MAVADAAVERSGIDIAKWAPRAVVYALIAAVVLLMPLQLQNFHSDRWSRAVIYAIVALSLNVLIGYAGQVSLGHQGFFGVGAFASAYMVTNQGQSFWVGVIVAGLSGAVASLLMGVVALRVTGLYLALVTLAYGRTAQEALFLLPAFGGGAGISAPRPAGFNTERGFYYLCLMFLVLIAVVDWRFAKTKAGRAINAIRENEQVASSYAINVRNYKLIAFVVAGIYVGIAGALFAHRTEHVVANDFEFQLALLFVIMTVVGGIRNRTGVIIGGVFFGLFRDYLADFVEWLDHSVSWLVPHFVLQNKEQLGGVVGAILLIVTLIQYPGGIGQQLRPITRWLKGEKFSMHHDGDDFVEEGVRGRP